MLEHAALRIVAAESSMHIDTVSLEPESTVAQCATSVMALQTSRSTRDLRVRQSSRCDRKRDEEPDVKPDACIPHGMPPCDCFGAFRSNVSRSARRPAYGRSAAEATAELRHDLRHHLHVARPADQTRRGVAARVLAQRPVDRGVRSRPGPRLGVIVMRSRCCQ